MRKREGCMSLPASERTWKQRLFSLHFLLHSEVIRNDLLGFGSIYLDRFVSDLDRFSHSSIKRASFIVTNTSFSTPIEPYFPQCVIAPLLLERHLKPVVLFMRNFIRNSSR
jgi:hypothetical protein